jgi:hypothetical protein
MRSPLAESLVTREMLTPAAGGRRRPAAVKLISGFKEFVVRNSDRRPGATYPVPGSRKPSGRASKLACDMSRFVAGSEHARNAQLARFPR